MEILRLKSLEAFRVHLFGPLFNGIFMPILPLFCNLRQGHTEDYHTKYNFRVFQYPFNYVFIIVQSRKGSLNIQMFGVFIYFITSITQ